MNQKILIVGNWKMNPVSQKDAIKLFSELKKEKISQSKIESVICPPALYLPLMKGIKSPLSGTQDVSSEEQGAHTGSLSPKMFKDMGVSYVIVGHSESRARGESDVDVHAKIKACLKYGLIPIVCVGERIRGEDHAEYFNVVRAQLLYALEGIPKASLKKIVIAYEPIWAIGKDALREATPAESLEMTIFIRRVLSDMFGPKLLSEIRILYGGSVSVKNAQSFLQDGGVQGLLIGRESLSPKKFATIINQAREK